MPLRSDQNRSGAGRALRAIRLALAFLTIIPQRLGAGAVTDAELAASRYAYPLVGGWLGLLLAVLSEAGRRWGAEPSLTAFLLVAAGVGLTGGLHLDGLADTSDGLFLWGDPERRLAAMRDPHVGSFGVTAVVLVLLGKFAALSALAGRDRFLALLTAGIISRTLVLVCAGMGPYARPSGTGRVLIEATRRRDAWGASLLVVLCGVASGRFAGVVASGVALLVAWVLTRAALRKLGGLTGDILGALIELSEMTILFCFALLGSLKN